MRSSIRASSRARSGPRRLCRPRCGLRGRARRTVPDQPAPSALITRKGRPGRPSSRRPGAASDSVSPRSRCASWCGRRLRRWPRACTPPPTNCSRSCASSMNDRGHRGHARARLAGGALSHADTRRRSGRSWSGPAIRRDPRRAVLDQHGAGRGGRADHTDSALEQRGEAVASRGTAVLCGRAVATDPRPLGISSPGAQRGNHQLKTAIRRPLS
jgi:hypothetical protein